jgi:hypothetical protein
MIKIEKLTTFKIEFTETQARELFDFLRQQKDCGQLTVDKDLILVYNELRKLFEIGYR